MINMMNGKILGFIKLLSVSLFVIFCNMNILLAAGCDIGEIKDIVSSFVNKECNVLEEECFWFSMPLSKLFKMMGQVGENVYNSLAGLEGNSPFIIPILGVCFAIWLAFQVMRYVSALYGQSPADFAMLIGTGIFRLVVAVALIMGSAKTMFNWFIGLFVSGAANIGTGIILQNMEGSSISSSIPVFSSEEPIVFLHNSIIYNVSMVARSFLEVVGYGYALWRYSFHEGLFCLLPSLEPAFYGIVLIIVGAVFIFIIPLKYLDIIFRLTLVYALLPLFIAAWVFPSTRKYAMKAWGMVVYAIFLMLVLSVLFALCTNMVTNYLLLGGVDDNFLKDGKSLFNFFAIKLDENKTSSMLLAFLVTTFIAIKITGQGKELSKYFSDSDSGNTAEGVLGKMQSVVGGSAVGAAAHLGRTVAGGAKDFLKDSGKAIKDSAKEGLKELGGIAKNKLGEAVGAGIAGVRAHRQLNTMRGSNSGNSSNGSGTIALPSGDGTSPQDNSQEVLNNINAVIANDKSSNQNVNGDAITATSESDAGGAVREGGDVAAAEELKGNVIHSRGKRQEIQDDTKQTLADGGKGIQEMRESQRQKSLLERERDLANKRDTTATQTGDAIQDASAGIVNENLRIMADRQSDMATGATPQEADSVTATISTGGVGPTEQEKRAAKAEEAVAVVAGAAVAGAVVADEATEVSKNTEEAAKTRVANEVSDKRIATEEKSARLLEEELRLRADISTVLQENESIVGEIRSINDSKREDNKKKSIGEQVGEEFFSEKEDDFEGEGEYSPSSENMKILDEDGEVIKDSDKDES